MLERLNEKLENYWPNSVGKRKYNREIVCLFIKTDEIEVVREPKN